MRIEARPGSFINKGGELMMRAIVAELDTDAELVVEPWIAPYADRARLGLQQKLWVRRLGPAASLPADLLPPAARSRFGIVREAEIDAVLDASGFRYSDDDRYGSRSAGELATNARRWHRHGTKVVLLPQALGPFEAPAVREPFLRALEGVDLVFARDATSEAHVRALVPGDARIRLAPDFTIPFPGRPPDDLPRLVGDVPFAAIVPNDRMLERTEASVAASYPAFLASAIAELAAIGLRPVLVLHEAARDVAFVERLRPALGPDGRVVTIADPVLLKGVLGAANVVVSSRYHALVSALSQGVPVVATGWSHKYGTLLESFGCPERLVDPRAPVDGLRPLFVAGLDGPERTRLVARQRERTAALSAEVRAMWATVRSTLGLPVTEPDIDVAAAVQDGTVGASPSAAEPLPTGVAGR